MEKDIKVIKLNNIEKKEKLILSIGVFDGIHKGHSSILEEMFNYALINNLNTGVVTFEDTYPKIFKKLSSFLLTKDEKKEILSLKGIDYMFCLPFDSKIRNLSPKDFIELLRKNIEFSCILVGDNFRFGKGRTGDLITLLELGKDYNFEVLIKSLDALDDKTISSSMIREALQNGDISLANKMLGYKYFIRGKVIKGDNIGKKIGFPTVNIKLDSSKLIPKNGIYKGKAKIKDKIYHSAIYIGTRPTFNGEELRIEAYIFDFTGDIYNEIIELVLEEYIRPDMKFSSLEELKKQITQDLLFIEYRIKEEEKEIKIITIDGTAGSGKTTIAKSLARKFNFDYIDSGALYRSVGFLAVKFNIFDESKLVEIIKENQINFLWDGEKFRVFYKGMELTDLIRTTEVGLMASKIGKFREIREIITTWQREHLKKVKRGLVLEGRDSGTVVFPNANLKLFINANIDIRSERRAKDLNDTNKEKVLESIKERDYLDINRDVAPLRLPQGGYFIDNSYTTIEEVLDIITTLFMRSM